MLCYAKWIRHEVDCRVIEIVPDKNIFSFPVNGCGNPPHSIPTIKRIQKRCVVMEIRVQPINYPDHATASPSIVIDLTRREANVSTIRG
jgi:hypothetical protein